MADENKKTVNNEQTDLANATRKPTAKDKKILELEEQASKAQADNERLQKEMDALKAQMAMFMQMAGGVAAQPTVREEEAEVEIGYRGFSKITVESPDSTVSLTFKPAEIKVVPWDDLKAILKESQYRKNKQLFEKDILYFVDEEYYKKLKIRKRIDLSDKTIKDILFTQDINDMIGKFNTLTNNKVNMTVMHIFMYKVAEMLQDPTKPLSGWNYENRVALEKYIGLQFDRLIEYSGIYKMINNR